MSTEKAAVKTPPRDSFGSTTPRLLNSARHKLLPAPARSISSPELFSTKNNGLSLIREELRTGSCAKISPLTRIADLKDRTPPSTKDHHESLGLNASETTSKSSPLNVDGTIFAEPQAGDDVFGNALMEEDLKQHPEQQTNEDTVNAIARRIQSNLQVSGYNGFTPRADRCDQIPSSLNAQGLYPPDALVFVANLSSQKSEDQLEVSCHQAFDTFGPCHIIVRYDKNKHPFAFVQFETVEASNDAIAGGRGIVIDGRQIRIERAKAERAVILSKVGGGTIPEEEARAVLDPYGAIEAIYPTTLLDSREFGMLPGTFVKFAYYLDCRDALRGFQAQSSQYRLYLAPNIEPRLRFEPDGSPVFHGFGYPRSLVDLKSIFVGNLPEGTTKDQLQDLFDEYGKIVQINIIQKSTIGDTVNVFAFLEFGTQKQAENATTAEKTLRGSKLRVEPKEYSARRSCRVAVHSPYSRSGRGPRRSAPAVYQGGRYLTHFTNNGKHVDEQEFYSGDYYAINGTNYIARSAGMCDNHKSFQPIYNLNTPPDQNQFVHPGMNATYHTNQYNDYETPPSMQRVMPGGYYTPPQHLQYQTPPNHYTPLPTSSYGQFMHTINEHGDETYYGNY